MGLQSKHMRVGAFYRGVGVGFCWVRNSGVSVSFFLNCGGNEFGGFFLLRGNYVYLFGVRKCFYRLNVHI